MTMQIKDSFYHANTDYAVVACSTPLLFDPREYGITPISYTTACYRGYWCGYCIKENRLVLQNLFIYSQNKHYPTIANIEAVPEQGKMHIPNRHRVYYGIQLPIIYTGRILVGSDPTPTHHIKGVCNDPWRYKDLREFAFKNGTATEIIDHSETAEDIRKFIRTMSISEPERGPMGTYVRFHLPLLGFLSNYPWWIELDRK